MIILEIQEDVVKSDYPELKGLAYKYWRKYTDRNDFNEYLQILYQYDLSFFKQLQQLMPAPRRSDGWNFD